MELKTSSYSFKRKYVLYYLNTPIYSKYDLNVRPLIKRIKNDS